MINITGLTKIFRQGEVQTKALNAINFDVEQGEFVAIMGPSGCGKSTLLHILGMLEEPSEGSYTFLDQDVFTLPSRERNALRKRYIGYIFQNFNLIEELTVYENVELPLIYQGMPAPERRIRVTDMLEKLEIAHRKHYFPMQLSGGQQQRVAIARAMCPNPALLLADEPTGNLDSEHGNDVMNLFINLNNTGTTIIMVTHSVRDAEYSMRLVNLLDGRIISETY